MVEEDAPDLVAALEAESVGARLGDQTDDGGVEVLVHDTDLAAAQAVLVDFTGDPSLVDEVVGSGTDDDGHRTTLTRRYRSVSKGRSCSTRMAGISAARRRSDRPGSRNEAHSDCRSVGMQRRDGAR